MNIDENNKEDVNNDSPDEYNIINHKKENEYTKKKEVVVCFPGGLNNGNT